MADDVEKYGAEAGHAAVSTETAGARLDDEARDKLAGSVESKLAGLTDEPSLSVSPEPDEEPKDDEPKDDEPVADDEPVDDEPEDDEPEDDEPVVDDDEPLDDEEAADKSKKDLSPTLPAAYRRSLVAYGWSEDEIDAALENNPEQFTSTALRIHRTRNEEISKFAADGRRMRQESGQDDNQPEPKKKRTDSGPSVLPKINREAMIEQYGNEEIIDAIVSPMNEVIEQINAVMPELQAGVTATRATQREALGKQIDEFFGSEHMTSYEEFYGKSGTERTQEQNERFYAVLEAADATVFGAAQQGRYITFEEAMDAAHSDVSKGFQEKAVRTKLKQKTKRRNKSISLKPSHSGKKQKASDKPTTRKQLEVKTRTALANVFS